MGRYNPSNCAHPEWNGVTAALKGRGAATTYVVEQCEGCGAYRKNDDPTFVDGDSDGE